MTGAYEIGPFRLDARAMVVTRDGAPVELGSRAVAVLMALVEKANQHLSKSEIINAAWPGLVVEEGNLAVQISGIRKVLARAPGGEGWIETWARRGYRFVGPVTAVPMDDGGEGDNGGRTGLPRPLTSFIGRDAARDDLREFLRGARLVTIVGTGGIGKTRLVVQVAEDQASAYRDGVLFADLAPLANAALVPSAIAQALGLRETPGRSLLQSLCAQLERREILIVLDNCEHVMDSAATAADALLRRCAGLTILATSREPLRVTGEQVYPLEPLSLPGAEESVEAVLQSEAGRLFMDRLRRHRPQFELTSEAARLVARLCVRLDGIPLALELAAARVPALSLEQIHERLDDRFQLLTSGSRTALPRQKTLRATFDWSHELLGDAERVLFRRCAVFAGGFSLEAARAVAGEPLAGATPAADTLSLLVTRSLLVATAAKGPARYAMLETTRAYALEQLEASGEAEPTRQRHAKHYRDAMIRACDDWLALSDARWHALHVGELDNVRAALDWALGEKGDDSIAVALAGASGPLWIRLSLEVEGAARLREALARAPASGSSADRGQLLASARLWLWFGVLAEGDTAEAHAAHRHAAALYRELGDPRGLGMALSRQGRMLLTMGQVDAAEAVLDEALPSLQASYTAKAMGLHWGNLGYLRMRREDTAGARANFEKALALHRVAGAEYSVIATLGYLADLAWQQGDLQASADAFRENIELFKGLPKPRRSFLGTALGNLAGVLTELGQLEDALAVMREGLPLLRESGFAWATMDHCALRAALAGDIANAARLGGYADAAFAKRNAQREPNEARALARLHGILARELAAGELSELRGKGGELDDEAACRLAVGDS